MAQTNHRLFVVDLLLKSEVHSIFIVILKKVPTWGKNVTHESSSITHSVRQKIGNWGSEINNRAAYKTL